MPIDSRHAFAGGGAYGRPSRFSRIFPRSSSRAWRSFDRGATVGEGCLLGPSAWCYNEGAPERIRLGDRVVCRGILRRELFGDGEIRIGDEVYIGDDCILSCAETIEIGAGTLLGHGVQIFDNNSHPTDPAGRAADWRAVARGGARASIEAAPVKIGARAWLGFGALILKGVTIGDEAVVGAGSIVTRDVEERTVVAGNPAEPR